MKNRILLVIPIGLLLVVLGALFYSSIDYHKNSGKINITNNLETSGNNLSESILAEKSVTLTDKNYDLSDFPAPFFINKTFNGKIIVGEKSSMKELRLAVGILSAIYEELNYTPQISDFDGPAILLDTEIVNISAYPLILVGGPNNNRIVADLLENGSKIEIPQNEGIVKLINNAFTEGYPALIIAGYDDNYTCLSGDILVRYKQYNLIGTEFIVNKTFTLNNESICDKKLYATKVNDTYLMTTD